MKYISLNIQTTSNHPDTGQIIECAAVLDDLSDRKPIEELPHFQTYVWHEEVKGQPEVLSWHSDTLAEIGTDRFPIEREDMCLVEDLPHYLHHFIPSEWMNPPTFAGKNFAGFDYQWLRRIPAFPRMFGDPYRALDPGPLYLHPNDNKVPSTKQCAARIGEEYTYNHDATENAELVVRLLRHYYGDEPKYD